MALAQGSLELEALSSRCSGVPWLHFLTMPDPFDEETDLRAVLGTLNPKARDDLRRVLIRDQVDRDAVASQLLPLPRPERRGLGRHHRHADVASGGAAVGGSADGEIEAT
jgi:hypothetical protein